MVAKVPLGRALTVKNTCRTSGRIQAQMPKRKEKKENKSATLHSIHVEPPGTVSNYTCVRSKVKLVPLRKISWVEYYFIIWLWIKAFKLWDIRLFNLYQIMYKLLHYSFNKTSIIKKMSSRISQPHPICVILATFTWFLNYTAPWWSRDNKANHL